MTLPAGTRLGPYKILSPLGAGGMGEVSNALWEGLALAGVAIAHSELGHAKESQRALEELIAKYAYNSAY